MTKIMTATEITDGQIEIIAVGLKQTKDCFTYKMRYGYHDPNLDLWLPLEQKARASGKATVWQLLEKLTFIEMAQNLLKTSETDIKKLSKLLIEGNHTFTLLEIEALIKRQRGRRGNWYAHQTCQLLLC